MFNFIGKGDEDDRTQLIHSDFTWVGITNCPVEEKLMHAYIIEKFKAILDISSKLLIILDIYR